jgi:hypothetical protein
MAKKNETAKVQRQGRRVIPAVRRKAAQAKEAAGSVNVTLGELIAAAFDTVGNEVKDVARLLSSRELQKCAGKRIVIVQ